MPDNGIQFAVVREDPEVEAALLPAIAPDAGILLIGSGGCTALTLAQRAPRAAVTLLEPNDNQIRLIQDKTRAVFELSGDARNSAFSIGAENRKAFTSCGNFESLFRSLRNFIHEFVADLSEWESFFAGEAAPDFLQTVFQSKYWKVAFDLFFSDSVLVAMFTESAIQHAAKNSYPGYFRNVLEIGLRREDASKNYFLHHILLGFYLDRDSCLPSYLTAAATQPEFTFHKVFAQDAPTYSNFALMSFSNIFDWMPDEAVAHVAGRLRQEAKPQSIVIFRQLNNFKDYRPLFGSSFVFDEQLAAELAAKDRSLFYSKLCIARKV